MGIGGLTFARVKGTGILPGISVEGLAELTVAPSCVVLTRSHMPPLTLPDAKYKAMSKGQLQACPLHLHSGAEQGRWIWGGLTQASMARQTGHGTYPGRRGGAQTLLLAMGGPGTGPGSTHSGYQLFGGSRRKGHAPAREEGKMSLPQSPNMPTLPAIGCPPPPVVLTMPFVLAGSQLWAYTQRHGHGHWQLPLAMSS